MASHRASLSLLSRSVPVSACLHDLKHKSETVSSCSPLLHVAQSLSHAAGHEEATWSQPAVSASSSVPCLPRKACFRHTVCSSQLPGLEDVIPAARAVVPSLPGLTGRLEITPEQVAPRVFSSQFPFLLSPRILETQPMSTFLSVPSQCISLRPLWAPGMQE